MAQSLDFRDKPLEELEREITCAVCQGVYQQAKLLPCNHYYCSTCIEKMATRSRGGPFDCPECRKETSLPPGGVADLQPAFFVERMKDVYDKMAKAEGKIEAVCDQCSAGKSVAFCRKCADFICSDCVRSHAKMRAFSDHIVANLEDLRKGGLRKIPVKEGPLCKCSEHKKTLKLFCFDCERLICRDCTIIDHRDHRFEFLNKCAAESRKTLCDSLAPLQKMVADLGVAEKTLVCEETKVERQKEEVSRSIQQSFDQLKAVLEQRKTELVEKASSLAQEKKEALAAQKRVLQVAQKEVQLLVEFVERNVESTSDQDLMTIQTQLQTKMEEEEKRHQQLSLEPAATADISCNLPSPDIIPPHLGSVFDQNTPKLYTNSLSSVQLGSPVVVTLVAPRASLNDVSASLNCVADPSSSLEGEVVQNGEGIFNISVTPQVQGRHDLIVKVRDREIAASPFHVFVKLYPMVLACSQPREIDDFNYPWGVGFNNERKLMVVDGKKGLDPKITVLERGGEKIQTIECDEFDDPCGVAVASDGAVYVTDIGAMCLFKFSSEGKLLKTVTDELQIPYSVKIIDSQLYVLDEANQLVKLFDLDCNVVGSIAVKECPGPGDIAQGPDGLYVAGREKISVYRCAPNGDFIRHLNLSPSSLKLSGFNGICFHPSSGYIIASDQSFGVYMFNPCGGCVQHISYDVIPHPAGVTVDDDGFVYVCSFVSNKVFIL